MVCIGNNGLNNRRLIEYAIAYSNIPPPLEMMTSVTRKLSIGFLHPCTLKLEHISHPRMRLNRHAHRKTCHTFTNKRKETNDILVTKSYYSYNY